MNATERKQKSRAAEKLGLVAAPRGYVTAWDAMNIFDSIVISEIEIAAHIKGAKK